METHYGLSEAEYLLMQFLWSQEDPVSFSDIFHYCNNVLQFNWAETTTHTYLTRLIKKGVLQAHRKGYKKSYYPQMTEQELSHVYSTRFVEEAYQGSLRHFLIALTYGTKLSQDEVDSLKKLLDERRSEEP